MKLLNKLILLLFVAPICVVMAGFVVSKPVLAVANSVTGKAKILNTESYLDFNASPYASNVSVDDATGVFSGYAFSEDLGWVAFGTVDNTDGPVAVDLATGVVSGKAKILNTGDLLNFNLADYASNVAINLTTGVFSGYAFSESSGWLDFGDTGVVTTNSFFPTAPSGFAGTANSSTVITWSWIDNSANETGFRVDNDGAGSGNLAAGAISWQETSLSPNQSYTRHVHAFTVAGDSAASGNGSVVTLAAVPTITSVATNNYSATDGYSLTVTVDANGNPAGTEYAITPDDGTNYLTSTGGLAGSETWSTSATWSHKSLTANTSYTYKVKARNSEDVETALSAGVAGTTAPTFPGNLASVVDGEDKATLSWTVAAGSATVDISYGPSSDASDSQVTGITATDLSKQLTGLSSGTTYYYKLRSVTSGSKYGAWSAIGNLTTTGLVLGYDTSTTTVYSDTKITPDWPDAEGTVVAYHLERASNSSYSDAAEIYTGTDTAYTNTGLTSNTIYYYRLKVEYTGSVFSSYSNSSKETLPTTPKDLEITADYDVTSSDGYTLSLSWNHGTASSGDVSYFKIYDGGERGSGSLVATVNNDTTTYKIVKLSPATTYEYFVYGYGLTSQYSPTYVRKSRTTVVSQVLNLKEVLSGKTPITINLQWDKLSTATGYQIYDSDNNLKGTIESGDTTSYTITGLTPNTQYKFYARGVDDYGEGQPSDNLTVTTLPKNATDLNITASIGAGSYTATKVVAFKNNSGFGEGSVTNLKYLINDSGSNVDCGSGSWSSWTGDSLSLRLDDGSYYLHFCAYNSNSERQQSETSSTLGQYLIDNTAPTPPTITYPVTSFTSNTHLAIYQFPIRGDGGIDKRNDSQIYVYVDSKEVGVVSRTPGSTGGWALPVINFSYGKHTIYAVATDSLGNRSPQSIELTFYVDEPVVITESALKTQVVAVATPAVITDLGYLGKGLVETVNQSVEQVLGPSPGYYFKKGFDLTFSQFNSPVTNTQILLPRLAINLGYLQKGFEMQINETFLVVQSFFAGIFS